MAIGEQFYGHRAQIYTKTPSIGAPTVTVSGGSAFYSYDYRSNRVRARKTPVAGWLYPKSYEREIRKVIFPYGDWRTIGLSDLHERRGYMAAQVQVPSIFGQGYRQDINDRAMVEAMLQLKDEKMNLPVAMAEAGKTAQLVGQTATKLAKTILHLKKGHFGSAAETLGLTTKKRKSPSSQWASNWLELRYGWNPLLHDVKGAADLLADLHYRAIVCTGIGKIKETDLFTTEVSKGGEYASLQNHRRQDMCKVRLDFEPIGYAGIEAKHAGILNPFEVAWELLPLSFVVDWFLPVGDTIKCLDYAAGLVFKSGSISNVRRHTYDISPGSTHPNTQWKKLVGYGSLLQFRRTHLTSAPYPLRPPHLKSPFSFKHMADGLSLLRGAINLPVTRI